jgi:hypothetical protein
VTKEKTFLIFFLDSPGATFSNHLEYTNADGTNAWCPRYSGGCRYRGRGAIQVRPEPTVASRPATR